jgi:hypothetical protein
MTLVFGWPRADPDEVISAATHAYLVVRRHVDYGRTRSMMCCHS